MSIEKPLSFWNFKPWWCQPWSIMLTGIVFIGGSWLLAKIWWVTAIVSIPVVGWWILFLWIVPQMVRYDRQESQSSLTQE